MGFTKQNFFPVFVPITTSVSDSVTFTSDGKREMWNARIITEQTLFVPVPHFSDVVQYNHNLLLKHERKASELHYKNRFRSESLRKTAKRC